jgi:hypothetical protein
LAVGPALDKISTLRPDSESGEPLENPFAETRRPYQIGGVPTQKGEATFILGQGEVAIEVKGTNRVDNADLRPLKTFIQEYRLARAFVVCNEGAPRVHENIRILPWWDFLIMLWNGKVIS